MDLGYILEQLREHLYRWTKQVGDCQIWRGLYDRRGRGRVYLISRWFDARDMAYILSKGPIPRGYKVVSSCENEQCLSGMHLFLKEIPQPVIEPTPPKTYKVRPSGLGGGEFRGNRGKFTDEEKQAIYQEYLDAGRKWGYQGILAKKYGCTSSLISVIIKNADEQQRNNVGGGEMIDVEAATAAADPWSDDE